MPYYKKRLTNVLEKAVYFIIGIIVAVLVSEKLEEILSGNEIFLMGAILLLVLIAVYLFVDSRLRIEKLADTMEATVYYLEEHYQEGVPYKGIIYQELAKWVSQSNREVLALAGIGIPEYVSGTDPSGDHRSRRTYLRALENLVKQNRGRTFKFVRIQQVAVENYHQPITHFLEKATTEHCIRLLDMKNKQPVESPCIVSIMRVATQRSTSFMVIDRRRIVIEVDASIGDGKVGAVGFFSLKTEEGIWQTTSSDILTIWNVVQRKYLWHT